MITERQAAANAANAQLSTGPRTEEGKARSSQNALKHGLTAKELVIREDEREEFEELRIDLTNHVEPEDPLEVVALNHAIHAVWNLKRYRRLEADLMANGLDPILDESSAKVLDRLHRYAGRAERAYYRAMEELRKLQTHRGLWAASKDVERCPVMADVSAVAKRTQEVDKVFVNLPPEARIIETYEQNFVPLRR
jgi:hypothetical protein